MSRARRLHGVAFTALALMFGLSGCGTQSASSQITKDYHQVVLGLLDGNGQQVCNQLTQGAMNALKAEAGATNKTCAEVSETLSKDLSPADRALIKNVHFTSPIRINGSHASVEDSTGGAADSFVRQNGHWYFENSSFAQ
jgi:hypothetical protein